MSGGGPIVHDFPTWVKDMNRRVELLERRRHVGGTSNGGGGGVTDHGLLTGLGDDDHPQYVTHAEGDAAYLSPSEVLAGTNVTVDNASIPGSVIISSTATGGLTQEHEVIVSATMPTDPLNELWVNTYENPEPPVETGGDKHYVHTQSVLATVWTVIHGLGKHPAVAVTDAAGSVVYGDVQHVSADQLTITFTQTATGTVYCN